MDTADLIKALKQLDELYTKKESFRARYLEETSFEEQYCTLREQIEKAYPGMIVAYVDVTYRMAHVLAPAE